jgi:signal peptidase I
MVYNVRDVRHGGHLLDDIAQGTPVPTPPPDETPAEAAVAASDDPPVATNAEAPAVPLAPLPLLVRPSLGENVIGIAREMLETVIFALLVFLIVQALSRNYKVQSVSMQPNLYEGQYVVVNRFVYTSGPVIDFLKRTLGRVELGRTLVNDVFHAPQRGEVIVFVPVTNTKPDLIKRVIGIEGDKVELRQGQVYVNDHPIDEPYIRPAPGQSWGPAVVGKDQLFVMGDNRGNSADSRVFGMLPIKNVVGKAWLRYWPPSVWGFIKHYDLKKQLP